MASVRFVNVVKRFVAETPALDRVSFDVTDGQLAVLMGPSGCGKTTTLRLIAGLEEPSSGEIQIGERPVRNVPPQKRGVAMMFQGLALYEHWSVFDNLAFGLKQQKTSRSKIERAVVDTARMLGIEHLLPRRCENLSGGEQQRVALGRAVARKPRVLLLDEPLAHLDSALRFDLRQQIRRLQRELRMTTIYVTHDQEEAISLADQVIVMQAGAIQQCGNPWDIYNRPANRAAAELIGRPPMNFLDVLVEHENGRLALRWNDVVLTIPGDPSSAWKNRVGKYLVLGMRPEDIEVLSGGNRPPNGWILSATVNQHEWIGPVSLTVFSIGNDQSLLAAYRGAPFLDLGSVVEIEIKSDAVQFFEPGRNGKKIGLAL